MHREESGDVACEHRAALGERMNVTVVGLGYVGLVTAGCIAEWGHSVTGLDTSRERRSAIRRGRVPFFEPGLDDLIAKQVANGRLRLEPTSGAALKNADVVVVAVGTHDGNGGWQTKTMISALEAVVPQLPDDAVLVIRSTLSPEFAGHLTELVGELRPAGSKPIAILINPEFTREGSALVDFWRPSRVVLGVAADPEGFGVQRLTELYEPAGAPVLVMSAVEAALAKLGANLFLATKISYANEIAALCDAYGGRVDSVLGAVSMDPRVGKQFLGAGIGFGGSCLPHQVAMAAKMTDSVGISAPLFSALDEINHRQRHRFVDLITELLDGRLRERRIAMLGLAFKPGTDDLRDAPSLSIARNLLDAGAEVVAYDPMLNARVGASRALPPLAVVDSVEEALMGADLIALVTEWPEFLTLEWPEVRKMVSRPILADGRNALSVDALTAAGFVYASFGRGRNYPQPGKEAGSPGARRTARLAGRDAASRAPAAATH